MSNIIGYHMSYGASAIVIAAILIPLYVWLRFAK